MDRSGGQASLSDALAIGVVALKERKRRGRS